MNEKININDWIKIDANSYFGLNNIPFGIFSYNEIKHHVASRIGDYIIDLHTLYILGYFNNLPFHKKDFDSKYLNKILNYDKENIILLRNRIIDLLINNKISHPESILSTIFISIDDINMLLPIKIGDYTDFYSSEYHAINIGKMFRDDNNPLLPNWKHLPVAYHGRSSSIVISGTPIIRPKGQLFDEKNKTPYLCESKKLDFEAEMAFITYNSNQQGKCIDIENAMNYVFGMCIFNDWSARDIQKWEYVPLGPFLGKNFASSISPWIVTMEALEPYYIEKNIQIPEPLNYLKKTKDYNIDIILDIYIKPKDSEKQKISSTNYKYLYWTISQQLAHHTINGCNIRCGDMVASGTISGKKEDKFGSMIELTWNGTKEIELNDGGKRKFLEDYDTIIIEAYCEKNNQKIGFGTVETLILPNN